MYDSIKPSIVAVLNKVLHRDTELGSIEPLSIESFIEVYGALYQLLYIQNSDFSVVFT